MACPICLRTVIEEERCFLCLDFVAAGDVLRLVEFIAVNYYPLNYAAMQRSNGSASKFETLQARTIIQRLCNQSALATIMPAFRSCG